MIELKAEIDTQKLQRAIRLFPGQLKLELADAFDHIALKFLKTFRAERLKGPPGIWGRPRGIFSHFHRSLLVSNTLEGMGARITSDSNIAELHEFGGVVAAPGSTSMAVPLTARTEMYTQSGQLRKRYKSPRNIKGLVLMIFNGKKYLVKVKKGSRDAQPFYVLKKKVKLKPRLGFYETFDNLQNVNIAILNKAVQKTLESV